MKKRVFVLILAMVMCMGIAAPAFAADSDFTIENGVLTKYNGYDGDVTIPNSVTSIGYGAFSGKGMTSVTIPNSVTSIGELAFAACEQLTSVTIPNSVASIENGTFQACFSLTSVTIPNSVTSIGDFAFNDCTKLPNVTIPNSVTSIGVGAFYRCAGLTNVTIPNSVTSLGEAAFHDCTGLTSIAIPDSVTSIGEGAFWGCSNLTNVAVPNSVTSIGKNMFFWCSNLISVTIPASVTTIGDFAFYGCNNLKDVYYGGSEAQWRAITIIKEGNDPLFKAAIHYNDRSDPPQGPMHSPAMPTNNPLSVNGTAASTAVYKIGGNNYFKLRDVAALLNGSAKQFDVGYDSATKSATITTGQGYSKLSTDLQPAPDGAQTATPSTDSVLINGSKADLTVYKINGNNYFKLRDLGKALDFYVGYDSATKSMSIDTSKPYSE